MHMLRFAGLFALIPTGILLTISFFVLFATRKVETQGLKVFGYVIAVLLWVAAALIFSTGVYSLTTGKHMKCGFSEMMKAKMHEATPESDMPKMRREMMPK